MFMQKFYCRVQKNINLKSDNVGIGIRGALSKVKKCQKMTSSIDKEFVDPAADK